jgi:hypothetical protein
MTNELIVHMYEPNLDRLRAEAEAISDQLELRLVQNSRFVQEFIRNALWLFADLCLRKWYEKSSEYDDPPKLAVEIGAENYKIPVTLRKVFQEICRPMVDESDVYVPNFTGIQLRKNLWTMGNQFLEDLNQFYSAMQADGVKLVPVSEEDLSPVPLTVWDPVWGGIAWYTEPSEERLEVFDKLRHARIQLSPGRPAVKVRRS